MLLLRRGVWQVRITVPLALRPLVGKREIWKSLKTADPGQAKLLALRVGAEIERQLQELRRRAPAAVQDPEALRQAVASKALADATERLLNADSFEEAIRRDIERDETRESLANLRDPVRLLHAAQAVNLVTTSDLLESYLTAKKLGSKSEAEIRAAFKRFTDTVGATKMASEVDKADVRAFKLALASAPSNRAGSGGVMSPVTVRKLLGCVATVFTWGVEPGGYLDKSPFQGMTKLDRKVIREPRVPYSTEDLKAIVGAVQGLQGAKRWLPLVAMWTGCRLEEGGGLRVRDICTEEGITYFNLVPHAARRLKNEGSRRRVPVHPELVRAGFLEYVKTLPADGLVFPELKPGPHGKLTGAYSKWWARFTDDLGITDTSKTFHSLRGGFKDACRAVGMSEEVHDALTGHTNGSVGRSYGLGVPLKVLAEALGKVSYSIDPLPSL